MATNKKIIAYVVNVDWFFISHRLSLAKHALNLNYSVYLLTKNTGKFSELENLGIKCIDINFTRSKMNIIVEAKVLLKLIQTYRKIKPNIVHQITLKPNIYGTISTKFLKHKPTIINAVSGLGYSFINNKNNFILKILMKIAFADKKSKFIFQNSDDFKLYQNLNLVSTNNYIIIKGSGVDIYDFQLKNQNISNKKIKIVLVARMLKDKGVLEFINAALILKPKFHNKFEFILVGGIDLDNPAHLTESDLMSFIDSKYIFWLGYCSNIKDIYNSADIVCLPSYREGVPKSLIEAMSIGCPIITTNAPGCKECVDDGVNGFLVPVADPIALANKLELLALNERLRIEMGLKSREKVLKDMSLEFVVNKTFQFYDE